MSNELLKLSIVTPAGLLYDDDVKEVYAPAAKGEIGVMPGHVPFISTTEPGIIHLIDKDAKELFFASKIGFLQVDDNKVNILVEEAKSSTDLEVAYIENKISELNTFLNGKGMNDEGYEKASLELKFYTKMLEIKE